MTNEEKNEAIAEILGFKKSSYSYSGETVTQWIYPAEYEAMRAGTPEHNCPDFIEIIERYLSIREQIGGAIPRMYKRVLSHNTSKQY